MPDPARAIALLEEAIGEKYEVLQWIGGGGMAQVYLARHRVTGGLFAVKVLADHLAQDETIVRRFIEEARTAATLSGHPNIVSIFDIGQHSGLHYLVMQFIDGEDLSTRLKRPERMPYAEAVQIVAQIAEALVWAQSKHVVHRDLKPANVRIDRSGRAVVLDFGIAKAGDIPSGLTAVGDRLGTPYYMSPEHFREGACDHRSDLYALGVMFFELLTGSRPFDGQTVRAIEEAHLFTPPRSPLDLDPSIPPDYARIVLRLMAKRREDRYQTASELLRDLTGEVSTSVPVTQTVAAPAPSAEVSEALPSAPPISRARLALYAGCGGLVLVILVVLGLIRHSSEAHPAAGLASTIHTDSGDMLLAGATPPFYIDATEVSNSAYKAYCDKTGAPYPPPPSWNREYFFAQPDHPVVNVTWRDAAAFAKWAGKRLPTEAEWEKVAAGSDGRRYPWGAEPPDSTRCRGGFAPAVKGTVAVSDLKAGASSSGALNMSGNVWEWTSTTYTPSGAEIAGMRTLLRTDPSGDWRVVKGGSFEDTDPAKVTGQSRAGFPAALRLSKPPIGFRCVRDPQ